MTLKGIMQEEKYHDAVADRYSIRRSTDYIWQVPEEIFLLKRNYIRSNNQVIEMGCGPAISLPNAFGQHAISKLSYIGVDISQKMLAFAKKNIPNGQFKHGDMSSIRLPKESADVIISLGALHHTEDKIKALQHWYALLKTGGLLLLREPLYEALKKGMGESPLEEGIYMQEFLTFVRKKKLRVVSLVYFNTNAFHFFNRCMIKIGLRGWQRIKTLWYPVVLLDVNIARLRNFSNFFTPQAFAAVFQKT